MVTLSKISAYTAILLYTASPPPPEPAVREPAVGLKHELPVCFWRGRTAPVFAFCSYSH